MSTDSEPGSNSTGAARRAAPAPLRPARAVMALLPYTAKIVLVVLVMALPLGYAMVSYLQAQGGQVDFATQERLGVTYLQPVAALEQRVVEARHAVTAGQPVDSAALGRAVDGVAAADARLGDGLATHQAWEAARTAVQNAGTVAQWTTAAESVISLASAASDGSQLTLDPDLDSYYVMDSVAFRFPRMLEDLGQLPDALAAAGAAPAAVDAARLQASATLGSLSTTLEATRVGMGKAFAATSDSRLLGNRTGIQAMTTAVDGAVSAVRADVAQGRIAAVRPGSVANASDAVVASWGALLPELDRLLSARIDRLAATEQRAIEVAAAGVVLALYLVAGFYLATVPPVRRMRDALAAMSAGDLRGRVDVDTRDEVGQMGRALNDTATALSSAVAAIDDSAQEVEAASAATSALSQQISRSASDVHTQVTSSAEGVAAVTDHATTVAEAGRQMSAAIREIASGASEAARTAAEAVGATEDAGTLIARLRDSGAAVRQVVALITQISDQTHLLALNASIEAARAGAAGDGFGVVADEVRDLARESAAAAEDIARRITAIEADSQDAASALGGIRGVIGRVSDIQATIAAAVEEQDASMAVLGSDVESVASAAAGIGAGIDLVEAAAGDSERHASEVDRVAAGLHDSARMLRNSVGRFRI